MAVQTMRSITYVQPGQTLGCVGCHEPRTSAPPTVRPRAAGRPPSRLRPGPDGSWPIRFDRLVMPVLKAHCLRCHGPEGKKEARARLDLAPERAYKSLVAFGGARSLARHVTARWRGGRSVAGACAAARSPVLAVLLRPKGHHGVRLGPDDIERLVTWMDTYGQLRGAFSPEQEAHLLALRRRWADLLEPR